MDNLLDDLEAIDWKACYDQVVAENEALRFRIVALRDSSWLDLQYAWDAALDWLTDPNHQVVLIMALSLLFPLLRELIKLLQRRNNRHEG